MRPANRTTLNDVELVAVPPGVTTETVPVTSDVDITAVTLVALTTVKLAAAIPPILTAVAPARLLPVIVRTVPAMPEAGETVDIVGGPTTVNVAALVPVPPGVVTEMVPVVAVVGTTAVMLVALTTLKLAAAVPLNDTAVAPVKFEPVRVTVAPGLPDVGVKLVMVGRTLNVLLLVAVPPAVVTEISPVVSEEETTAVMLLELTTLKLETATPLILTPFTPVKYVPVIVTVDPTAPDAGAKLEMVGA